MEEMYVFLGTIIIGSIFFSIPLISGIIIYKYTKFRKKLYKYIPAFLFYIANVVFLIISFSIGGCASMAYIIPILASNSIGILFFILALTSDYIKSKKTYNRER